MNRAVDYISQIHDLLAPERADVAPGGVEMDVQGTVHGRPLHGRVDLVVRGKRGELILVDFKAGKQVDFSEGQLYSDIISRHVDNLPIRNLITDDDFFQLRTYDYLLNNLESEAGRRQLMQVHISQARVRTITVTEPDRETHGELLVNIVGELEVAEKSRIWEGRHGQHCRRCLAARICPLSRGDEMDLLPSASELEQKYLSPGTWEV